MARSSDPKKLALWQGRFQRFLDSGLAATRFCAVEGVSESSFYYWQKKLGPQVARRPTRAEDHGTCAIGHCTCAKGHCTCAEDCGAGSVDHGVFRPVTVMPATCGVVVRLPGGARIEVDADHLDAIRAVVAETVRVDQGRAADRNAPSNNQVMRNAPSNNQVMRNTSSNNQVIRKASSGHQVTRNASSDNQVPKTSSNNQVIRKTSSNNQVIRQRSSDKQVIRKQSGTVSC